MILALHGNLGSPKNWERLEIPDLRAVSLWNHSHLTLAEFAEEISATEERPILAGYSLGGRLALHAMANFPDRWSGAVIVSAHPGLPCGEDRIARRLSDEVWASRVREWNWNEFLGKWNEQSVLALSPSDEEQRELGPRREEIAQAFENWSLGCQEDLRSGLRKFTQPVLWITGERDVKFSDLGREMMEVFSDYRHEIIRECGHRVLQENPAELARLVSNFIRTATTAE